LELLIGYLFFYLSINIKREFFVEKIIGWLVEKMFDFIINIVNMSYIQHIGWNTYYKVKEFRAIVSKNLIKYFYRLFFVGNLVVFIICLILNILVLYFILFVSQFTFFLMESCDTEQLKVYSKSFMPLVTTMGGAMPLLKGVGVVAFGTLLWYNWDSINASMGCIYESIKSYFTGSPPPSKGAPLEVGVLTSATGDILSNPLVADVATKFVSNSLVEQAAVATTSNVAQAAVSETTASTTAVDVTNVVVRSVPRSIFSAQVSAGVHTVATIHSCSSLSDLQNHFRFYVDLKTLNGSISLFITKPSTDDLSTLYVDWFYQYVKPLIDNVNIKTNTSSIKKIEDITGETPVKEVIQYSCYIHDQKNADQRIALLNRLSIVLIDWIKSKNSDSTSVETGHLLLDKHNTKLSLKDLFEKILRRDILKPQAYHLFNEKDFFKTLDVPLRTLIIESIRLRTDIRFWHDEWKLAQSSLTLTDYLQEKLRNSFIEFLDKK
jgi:hypothetical protein